MADYSQRQKPIEPPQKPMLRTRLEHRAQEAQCDMALLRTAAKRIGLLEHCLRAAVAGKPARPIGAWLPECEAMVEEFPGLKILFNGKVLGKVVEDG